MTRTLRIAGLALLALAAACENFPPDVPPGPPSLDQQLRANFGQWGVVPIGAMPPQDPALVALGQALMFDKILSGNRDISCMTCHEPSRALTDGLSLSIGTGGTGSGPARTLGAGREFVPRSAPTLINQGLRPFEVFWDGRVSGFGAGPFQTPQGVLPFALPTILAAQAMFPVLSRREMRGDSGDLDVFGNPNELAALGDSQHFDTWRAIMQRLLAIPEYVTMFNTAFPGTPSGQHGFQHAATAIGAFEMAALTRVNTPFDRYLARDDNALTDQEKRGGILFFAFDGARCASCHSGPLLGGQQFANVGAPQLGPGSGPELPLDLGRGAVGPFVGQPFYRFSFRAPPLRNVELTAPYFHAGAYPTLEAVVRHYNDAPAAMRNFDVTQLHPSVRGMFHGGLAVIADMSQNLDHRIAQPLNLTDAEMADIVAFLKSLTDPAARDMSSIVPARVPSGLPVN